MKMLVHEHLTFLRLVQCLQRMHVKGSDTANLLEKAGKERGEAISKRQTQSLKEFLDAALVPKMAEFS